MSDRTFELNGNDCAVIIRGDGQVESVIPSLDDEAPVSDSALLAVATAASLVDPKQIDIIRDFFLSLIEALPQQEKIQTD